MKNLILTILLMVLVIPLQSQNDGLIFIAEKIYFAEKEYEYNSDGEFKEKWDWKLEAEDISIPVHLGKKFIVFDNNGEVTLEITDTFDPIKTVDADGDDTTFYSFKCKDNDGDDPLVMIQSYPEFTLVRLMIYYDRVAIRYSGYLQ